MLLELEQLTSLGPARVVAVAANRIQIELPDSIVWAVSAIAFPYEPTCGDDVLAIGDSENWYVIGVLRGAGKTSFVAPADMELRAPRGAINLVAAKGIRIAGPEIGITAGKLEIAAKSVFERFESATRWIRDVFQIRARRIRTRVESTWDVKAERIVQQADGDVKIDGKTIHLG